MKFDNLFQLAGGLESKDTTCPGCRQAIPLDDINIAKDIALCRGCGKVWTFSLIRATQELARVNLQNPPRGVRFERDHHGVTSIGYHRIPRALIFLIPFTACWSGFSMFGIYGSQFKKGQFDLSQSLFGLPFLIGTAVLCSIILFGLFGRWQINIRRGEGTCFVGVGPIGWRRRFTVGPQASVSLEMSSYRVNQVPQEAITIHEGGVKIISFGASIASREAKVFIAAAMSGAMA